MKSRTLSLAAAAAVLLLALPAHAVRFNFGVGTGWRIPGTGLTPNIGFSHNRWGNDINPGLWIDAGYYLNRSRERRAPKDREERRSETRIALRVSPNDAWVYLNGVPIDAYGSDDLSLPPGHHCFEFLKEGYRTEAAELDVRPGGEYRIDRRLDRLGKEDDPDPRLARQQRPMALKDALQATVSVWSREDTSRPRREDARRNDDGRDPLPRRSNDGRDPLPRRNEELQRKYDRVNPDVPRDPEHEPDREDR